MLALSYFACSMTAAETASDCAVLLRPDKQERRQSNDRSVRALFYCCASTRRVCLRFFAIQQTGMAIALVARKLWRCACFEFLQCESDTV